MSPDGGYSSSTDSGNDYQSSHSGRDYSNKNATTMPAVPPSPQPPSEGELNPQMLLEAHKSLSKVGFGRSVGKKGMYDREYWTREPEPGNDEEARLALKPGKRPADAIKAITDLNRLWTFDCGEYVQVLLLYTKLKILGAGEFNKQIEAGPTKGLFYLRASYSTGLETDVSWERHKPTDVFARIIGRSYQMVETMTEAELLAHAPVGAEIVFSNVANEDQNNAWRNEHTVKAGSDQYIAHGQTEWKSKLVRRRDIEKRLAREMRIPDSDEAYIRKNIYLSAVVPYH